MPVTRTDPRRSPAPFGGRSGRRVAWDRKVRPRWLLRVPSPRVSGSRARRPKREPDTCPLSRCLRQATGAPSVGRGATDEGIPYGIFDLSADSGQVNVGTAPRHRRVRRGIHPPHRRRPGCLITDVLGGPEPSRLTTCTSRWARSQDAEAIRRALPDAIQVADRWHLWHNFGEAVLKEVAGHSPLLSQRPDRPCRTASVRRPPGNAGTRSTTCPARASACSNAPAA